MPKEALDTVESAVEHELVVVEAFAGRIKGEVISDAETVKSLLESEWSAHFVKRLKAATNTN